MAASPSRHLDPDELAAFKGFLTLHARVVRGLDEELRAVHRLPLSSYDVLTTLESAPDHRLRMRDLADAIVLSRSGLTRLVDRLARDGLVEREECEEDARGAFAVLTARGRDVLHEARPTLHEGVRRRFFAGLDQAQVARLRDLFTRMQT